MHAWLLTAVFLYLTAVPRKCDAFSIGPPASTCRTKFPKHGAEKQTGKAPFALVFSSNTYSPGQTITVKLITTEVGRKFKGFQISAHRMIGSGNAEEFIGTFGVSAAEANTVDILNCLLQTKKIMGHKEGSPKTSISGTWTAPVKNEGHLQFFLTVVEEKPKFWHAIPFKLEASTLTGVTAPDQIVPQPAASGSPNWNDCGVTKGCWFVPTKGATECTGTDCQAILSYQKQSDGFFLEMAVKGQDQYISVGFSHDKLMGDDQTILCTAIPNYQSVQLGYNPAKSNDRQFTVGLSNLTVGQVDGQAYCSLKRSASLTSLTPDGQKKEFDVSKPYYIFLAWGRIYSGTDILSKHSDAPAISTEKMDLSNKMLVGLPGTSAAPGHFPVSWLLCAFVAITNIALHC